MKIAMILFINFMKEASANLSLNIAVRNIDDKNRNSITSTIIDIDATKVSAS
jgi:hypothetical protein